MFIILHSFLISSFRVSYWSDLQDLQKLQNFSNKKGQKALHPYAHVS